MAMPFKTFIDNAAYFLVYSVMILIIIIEQHFFYTGKSPHGLAWAETLLFLLPLVCLLSYGLWKLSIFAKAYWKKHNERCSINQSLLVSTLQV